MEEKFILEYDIILDCYRVKCDIKNCHQVSDGWGGAATTTIWLPREVVSLRRLPAELVSFDLNK